MPYQLLDIYGNQAQEVGTATHVQQQDGEKLLVLARGKMDDEKDFIITVRYPITKASLLRLFYSANGEIVECKQLESELSQLKELLQNLDSN